jgi:hypothetical protein
MAAVGIATAATAMAVPKLHGTVGPGFTISLKDPHGKTLKALGHGKYTFIVRDKTDIHNFTLNGPGIKNKTITGTSFVGTEDGDADAQEGEVQDLLHRVPDHRHRDVQSHLIGQGGRFLRATWPAVVVVLSQFQQSGTATYADRFVRVRARCRRGAWNRLLGGSTSALFVTRARETNDSSALRSDSPNTRSLNTAHITGSRRPGPISHRSDGRRGRR